MFNDTKPVVNYEKTFVDTFQEQWECLHCGRIFLPFIDAEYEEVRLLEEAEKVRLELTEGCPSDDCPSHKEMQGNS